jgi:acetyl esterase/lipase
MKLIQDEVFAEREGVRLRFDMIAPQGDVPLPAVICIHGGGWVSGDKSDMHEVARRFAAAGFAAFCPQYRLAPLYPYPAAIEDCREFLRFVSEHAQRLHIDADRVASFGNSAGGHLSALLAMSNADARVNAAIDVSGLTDLTKPQENHPAISWDFIGQFMGVPYAGNESKWIEASPLFQVTPESAPMLIVHGVDDDIVWVEQSKKLHDALIEAGVKSDLRLLDSEGHAFSEPGFSAIIRDSVSFLEECGLAPLASRA